MEQPPGSTLERLFGRGLGAVRVDQASAALDKVVPPDTQLPAAVTTVVDTAASGAQAVKAAAAPAVAAVRKAAANPTVAAAAGTGLGKAPSGDGVGDQRAPLDGRRQESWR